MTKRGWDLKHVRYEFSKKISQNFQKSLVKWEIYVLGIHTLNSNEHERVRKCSACLSKSFFATKFTIETVSLG